MHDNKTFRGAAVRPGLPPGAAAHPATHSFPGYPR